MSITVNLTSASRIFFDTDFSIEYRIWQGNPTAAQIAANTAVPQDVTGWTFSWMMRQTPSSPDPALITKTSGSGITITGVYNADPLVNTQRVIVTIEDTDTYDPDVSPAVDIPAGLYYYGLKRIDAGNERILTEGKLQLLQAAPWE